jgi:hypothetical protein
LALAEAGPTAAPTATVLMKSAAAMATRVRVKGDCDDIELSFSRPPLFAGRCQLLIKERANPGKLPKKPVERMRLVDFPNQELAANPNRGVGTFATRSALMRREMKMESGV